MSQEKQVGYFCILPRGNNRLLSLAEIISHKITDQTVVSVHTSAVCTEWSRESQILFESMRGHF